MTTRSYDRGAWAVLAVFAAVASAQPAVAQSEAVGASGDSRALEEVIVTARKRTESLQDSPITVSAFGAGQLKDAGISNLKDLTGVVPGLDLQAGNGVNRDANPYIRGVGQRETRVTLDTGVGVYINGVYMARASGALLDFVDVEQVQVLRGPQGTLFGKNTTGGAIVVDTVKPGPDFGAYVELTAGNFARQNVKSSVNLPLIDDVLSGRFSIASIRRDGFITNLVDGRKFSDDDTLSWMAQLNWNPTDNIGVDGFIAGTRARVKPRGQRCQYVNDERGIAAGEGLLEGAVNLLTAFDFKETCEFSENLEADKFLTDLSSAQPQGRNGLVETDTLTSAVTVNWELGDLRWMNAASIKQILAYRNTKNRQDQDLDGTVIPILTRYEPGKNNTDQYSYEFQLTGAAFGGALDLTTGFFLFSEETTGQVEQDLTLGAISGMIGPAPALTLIGSTLRTREADNKAFSVFAQGDWNFNESMSLTMGLRWTMETRETAITETVPAFESADASAAGAFFGTLGLPSAALFTPADQCSFDHINSHAQENYAGFSAGGPGAATSHFFESNGQPVAPTPTPPSSYSYCNADRDANQISDSAFTPMASLNIHLSDESLSWLQADSGLLFFTLSQGFRSGVIVDAGNPPSEDFPQLGGADDEEVGGDLDQADPEHVTNFEMGLKLEALDRRLRLNSALFVTDYEDFQLTAVRLDPVTGGPATVLDNIGGARFVGLEVEATALLPWNLRMLASLSLIDAKTEEFNDLLIVDNGMGGLTEQPIDRSDEPPPNVAERQLFINLVHDASLGAFGTLKSSLQMRYIGEVNRHFDRGSFESRQFISEAEAFFDASLQWRSPAEQLSVEFWVKNLADIDDYYVGGIPLVDFLGGGGQIFAEPRTFGLNLRYEFGS